MNRTDLAQTSEARSSAPAGRCYYLFMCSGAELIVIDAGEQRQFVLGQLAVAGVAVFALAVAMLIQAL